MATTSRVPVTRYRELGRIPRVLFYISTVISVGAATYYVFGYVLFGFVFIDWGYYYFLIGLLLPFVFLFFPMKKGDLGKIPGYDYIFTILSCGISFYFFLHARDMSWESWALYPSPLNFSLALILCLLVLEGARRTGGPIFFAITALIFVYPVFAEHLPGLLRGAGLSLQMTVGFHAFEKEGLLGIPMKVVGEILIGFLIFAALLIRTGGGDFFLNIALAMAGRFRGGPAKVAVLASGLFGSLSGSIISNIVATGSVTIPTMKKIGYPPHYAAAIEACASTGGVLAPPIMGAVAFIMAALLDIPYRTIIVAALIPSLLYYGGLLLQTDAYAAKNGLRGIPREELPSIWQTLKAGWHFIFVMAFLVWGLLYMRWETLTPFYASVVLLVLSMLRKETRINAQRLIGIIEGVGRLLSETVGIILPIGLIMSGLVVTGMAPALTAGIVSLSQGIPFIGLLLGAVVCYILGTTGLMSAAYIFLAITLAPSLVQIGFNLFAVHFFIIYYAMLSAITPPVAVGAFVASAIAGASPMKTAWQAMRLGIVIYFIPFFFVFEPSLVLQGALVDTLWYFATCALGIFFLAAGVEGYLLGLGNVSKMLRPLLAVAGILIAFPDWKLKIIGVCLTISLVAIMFLMKRRLSSGSNVLGANS